MATGTVAKPPTPEPQDPASQDPEVPQCRKCGSTDRKTQLRQVVMTVGWKLSQFSSVCPANMCNNCGDLTCDYSINIGDLANLQQTPQAAQAVPTPQPKAVKSGKPNSKSNGRKKKKTTKRRK